MFMYPGQNVTRRCDTCGRLFDVRMPRGEASRIQTETPTAARAEITVTSFSPSHIVTLE